MLNDRRREMQDDVRGRIKSGRAGRRQESGDELDHADAGLQGDLEFTLLQMRTQTLSRIDEALARLDAGTYGICVECDGEIAEPRLRALPFAIRCQACEKTREDEQAALSRLGVQRGNILLFPTAAGPRPSAR